MSDLPKTAHESAPVIDGAVLEADLSLDGMAPTESQAEPIFGEYASELPPPSVTGENMQLTPVVAGKVALGEVVAESEHPEPSSSGDAADTTMGVATPETAEPAPAGGDLDDTPPPEPPVDQGTPEEEEPEPVGAVASVAHARRRGGIPVEELATASGQSVAVTERLVGDTPDDREMVHPLVMAALIDRAGITGDRAAMLKHEYEAQVAEVQRQAEAPHQLGMTIGMNFFTDRVDLDAMAGALGLTRKTLTGFLEDKVYISVDKVRGMFAFAGYALGEMSELIDDYSKQKSQRDEAKAKLNRVEQSFRNYVRRITNE